MTTASCMGVHRRCGHLNGRNRADLDTVAAGIAGLGVNGDARKTTRQQGDAKRSARTGFGAAAAVDAPRCEAGRVDRRCRSLCIARQRTEQQPSPG